jgi:hypothetical protein
MTGREWRLKFAGEQSRKMRGKRIIEFALNAC